MSIPLMFALKDVIVKESAPTDLLLAKHCHFIQSYEQKKEDYEYVVSEYLRLSGVFWCLTALDLAGQLEKINRDDVIDFLLECRHSCGGFGACKGHDPHLLHTLSAVQILVMYDALDVIDVDGTADYVSALQQPDGSFAGDEWGITGSWFQNPLFNLYPRTGEVDTRFSFCAVASLALINRLQRIDLKKAVQFVLQCSNFDGGFGTRPGSESHAGQIYCCLGTLSIVGQLHRVDADKLGWWLCGRQCASGGLNGRPEKLPDVCYSWWVLASLTMIGRQSWIDRNSLRRFILACQEEEKGGIADRPGDEPDPFHTLFGLAGLSLLGEPTLEKVNAVFCMAEKRLPAHLASIQLLEL